MNIHPLVPVDTIVTGIQIACAFVVAGVAAAGILRLKSAIHRIVVHGPVPSERKDVAPSR